MKKGNILKEMKGGYNWYFEQLLCTVHFSKLVRFIGLFNHNNIQTCTVSVRETLESPLNCKEIQSVNPKGNQSWIFIGRTDAEAEAPTLWPPDVKNWLIGKDPDAGKRLKAGGEGGDRGWDGWMASPTQWTCAWASSGRWRRTGKSGVLQSMGSQRVGHDWATELNWQ